MKTLQQVQKITDLEARVINAAALLELELRQREGSSDSTLGELVQKQARFADGGYLRDINFGLRVRNEVAHWTSEVEPSKADKISAARHLLQAVTVLRGADNRGADRKISRARAANSFDEMASQEALSAIYRKRRRSTFIGGLIFIAIGALVSLYFWQGMPGGAPVPSFVPIGVAMIFAASLALRGVDSEISNKEYYSLPGARFANGDHRCIHCGHQGRQGRGIYVHGKYKSSTKYHDCSKCGENLFTS